MPWPHCNNEIHDDAVCPTCGTTKAAWTVAVNVTRRLVIGGKAQLVVRVEGPDGGPRGVKVRVLPTAAVTKQKEWTGDTDPTTGEVRFSLPPSHYRVTFPEHPPESFSSDRALFEPLALRKGEMRCVFQLALTITSSVEVEPPPILESYLDRRPPPVLESFLDRKPPPVLQSFIARRPPPVLEAWVATKRPAVPQANVSVARAPSLEATSAHRP